MRARWVGIIVIVVVAVAIVAHKGRRSHNATAQLQRKTVVQLKDNPSSTNAPTKAEVILVADLSEASKKGDNCAEIIHLVREAGKRGIKVQEFAPDSDSLLIKQYHVLTVPTVLVLDPNGKVVSRYEGESGSTVREIRTRLTALDEAEP